jgi:UDP-N-acetylmuramoyl-L-alanyl-D-glutamate--2,6-diaminopimelate ligase
MNALQAAAAAWAIGVPAAAIQQALSACTAPPGRLEPVTTPDDPFAVLVDYAHTDDALLNVLTALRPLVGPGGRLITVFGCGGDRDRTKRPRMMRVACEGSDRVVVTSDNPRTEDPEAIIDEVMAGRPAGTGATVVRQADRARAIRAAVEEARPGDIVLVAGKGHEDYQVIGTEKRPFDDRLVAREALGRGAGAARPVGAGR